MATQLPSIWSYGSEIPVGRGHQMLLGVQQQYILETRRLNDKVADLTRQLELEKQSHAEAMEKLVAEQKAKLEATRQERDTVVRKAHESEERARTEAELSRKRLQTLIESHVREFNGLVNAVQAFRQENCELINKCQAQEERLRVLERKQTDFSQIQHVAQLEISQAQSKAYKLQQQLSQRLTKEEQEVLTARLGDEELLRTRLADQEVQIKEHALLIDQLQAELAQERQVKSEMIEHRRGLETQLDHSLGANSILRRMTTRLQLSDDSTTVTRLENACEQLRAEKASLQAELNASKAQARQLEYLEQERSAVLQFQEENRRLKDKLRVATQRQGADKEQSRRQKNRDQMEQLFQLLSPERQSALRQAKDALK